MASTSMNRKALAAFVCLKAHTPASVLKDWSYKTVAERMGVSVNTAKRYIKILSQNRLVAFGAKNGHSYLFLSRIRSKRIIRGGYYIGGSAVNHDIKNFAFEDFREIEKQLAAQFAIVETSRKMNALRQATTIEDTETDYQVVRKKLQVCKKCRCGLNTFINQGISVRCIAGKLHCGLNKALDIINTGILHDMYKRIVPKPIGQYILGIGKFLDKYGGTLNMRYTYYTRNNIYIQECSKYYLPLNYNEYYKDTQCPR